MITNHQPLKSRK